MRIADLTPGDRVTMPGPDGEIGSVFVGRIYPHPVYGAPLDLVIWRMDDGAIMLDALAATMELPASTKVDGTNRRHYIYRALFPKK